MNHLLFALAAAILAFAPAVLAAPPEVPVQISYQGVLLDSAGEPRTGNVDLILRIFDAVGSGTLVYKQVFNAVPLSAGVFTVRLGPVGASTDTPTNPLTTSLADALGGDAGPTAPGRFLEVTVGLEGALARTQILTAPYALRAASADSAAVADNVTAINGLDPVVVNQIFQYGNSDDSGPINSDPLEGMADTDGDGAMNFIDVDNDNDTIGDTTEVNQGSHVNVVTPILNQGVPPILAVAPGVASLAGGNFDPAMTVLFDGAPFVPFDVTPASARFQPPSHPVGTFPLLVELPNGELSRERTIDFLAQPTDGVNLGFSNQASVTISVRGAARVAISNDQGYAVDLEDNGSTEFTAPSFDQLPGSVTHPTPAQVAVAWGADGRLVGLRCHPTGSGCQVQVIRDSNGDLELDPGTDELLLGPSYTGTDLSFWAPSLASDPSGRIVAAYMLITDAGATKPTVLHDRDGNGAFAAGAPETVEIETINGRFGNGGGLAVDAAGRVAYAYAFLQAGNVGLRVAYDRNGDGDFADTVAGTPERVTAFVAGASQSRPCAGVAFDGAGHLAAVFAEPTASAVRLLRDNNGDGDFGDVGDSTSFHGNSTSGCAVASHPIGGLAMVSGGTLSIDRNSDGDFGDANENVNIPGASSSNTARLGVTFNQQGRAFVAGHTPDSVFVDPH